MEAFVNFAKVWVGDVSVNLSRADISVAEKGLDGADVGTVHQKISSEAMAERVRCDMLGDASFSGVALDDAFD